MCLWISRMDSPEPPPGSRVHVDHNWAAEDYLDYYCEQEGHGQSQLTSDDPDRHDQQHPDGRHHPRTVPHLQVSRGSILSRHQTRNKTRVRLTTQPGVASGPY